MSKYIEVKSDEELISELSEDLKLRAIEKFDDIGKVCNWYTNAFVSAMSFGIEPQHDFSEFVDYMVNVKILDSAGNEVIFEDED